VTGSVIKITDIRAKRPKPGLGRQHLTCVEAAAKISTGRVHGNQLGSDWLRFEPGTILPGEYRFDVGTAGSCTLVLQTILPALMLADQPSRITLKGGTHNPMAPPFDFLERTFAPALARMGPQLTLQLVRPGYFPKGQGKMIVDIHPVSRLQPLELIERGTIAEKRARAYVTKLSHTIADREFDVVHKRLDWPYRNMKVVPDRTGLHSGNVLFLEIESEGLTEVFTGFGLKNVRAEDVAKRVCGHAENYLKQDGPVGAYLADQLLIPFALAGSGAFRTVEPSDHTTSNMQVIEKFLPVTFEHKEVPKGKAWEIRVNAK
jgi:RNA 3'-terminal phosphate cyclase (ATP)